MNASFVIHQRTRRALEDTIVQQPHALILIGRPGMGKELLAKMLTGDLLGIDLHMVDNHQFVKIVSEEGPSISIDVVRDIQHFLSRKTTSQRSVSRAVLLPDAHRLTREAQNALLKTLEEPPVDSIIIMTASDEQSLLPTVLSRSQKVHVLPPTTELIQNYFSKLGYTSVAIERAIFMSGGLPGLVNDLLVGSHDHPMFKAAGLARDILRQDTSGRLALVDTLSKQRETCTNVLFILQQMADISLRNISLEVGAQKQWRNIMQEAYAAEQALAVQAQPKLVLTNLMLSLATSNN